MDVTEIINKLHRFERKSVFTNDLFNPIYNEINKICNFFDNLKKQFFFDTLTFALPLYEKMLNITTDTSLSINDRRSIVQAKWLSNGHNSIKLIQKICKYFKNGTIEAKYISGKIQLKFIDSFGIPSYSLLSPLISQINEIKPAHIPIIWVYKFLLKKDIHNKLTKLEIEKMKKNVFCEVKINE